MFIYILLKSVLNKRLNFFFCPFALNCLVYITTQEISNCTWQPSNELKSMSVIFFFPPSLPFLLLYSSSSVTILNIINILLSSPKQIIYFLHSHYIVNFPNFSSILHPHRSNFTFSASDFRTKLNHIWVCFYFLPCIFVNFFNCVRDCWICSFHICYICVWMSEKKGFCEKKPQIL